MVELPKAVHLCRNFLELGAGIRRFLYIPANTLEPFPVHKDLACRVVNNRDTCCWGARFGCAQQPSQNSDVPYRQSCCRDNNQHVCVDGIRQRGQRKPQRVGTILWHHSPAPRMLNPLLLDRRRDLQRPPRQRIC